ncbi:unnamed protein product [Closterium sp. NIES-65]|nr:unnamed protein product [Closterium sp. NIES-65]
MDDGCEGEEEEEEEGREEKAEGGGTEENDAAATALLAKADVSLSATATCDSFADLALAPWLVATCHEMGLRHPTPVQCACIPPVVAGSNVIGVAQTGSGKTAAFALPILQKLPKALLMGPCADPVGFHQGACAAAVQIAHLFRNPFLTQPHSPPAPPLHPSTRPVLTLALSAAKDTYAMGCLFRPSPDAHWESLSALQIADQFWDALSSPHLRPSACPPLTCAEASPDVFALLLLNPTRELALQIADQFRALLHSPAPAFSPFSNSLLQSLAEDPPMASSPWKLALQSAHQFSDPLPSICMHCNCTAPFQAPLPCSLQKQAEGPYGVFALVRTPTRKLARQIAHQFCDSCFPTPPTFSSFCIPPPAPAPPLQKLAEDPYGKLADDPYGVLALVLTPTRELALQIADRFQALLPHMHFLFFAYLHLSSLPPLSTSLQKLAEDPYGVFALVLTPTRELALQIADQFRALGSSLSLRCAIAIGGGDMVEQVSEKESLGWHGGADEKRDPGSSLWGRPSLCLHCADAIGEGDMVEEVREKGGSEPGVVSAAEMRCTGEVNTMEEGRATGMGGRAWGDGHGGTGMGGRAWGSCMGGRAWGDGHGGTGTGGRAWGDGHGGTGMGGRAWGDGHGGTCMGGRAWGDGHGGTGMGGWAWGDLHGGTGMGGRAWGDGHGGLAWGDGHGGTGMGGRARGDGHGGTGMGGRAWGTGMGGRAWGDGHGGMGMGGLAWGDGHGGTGMGGRAWGFGKGDAASRHTTGQSDVVVVVDVVPA